MATPDAATEPLAVFPTQQTVCQIMASKQHRTQDRFDKIRAPSLIGVLLAFILGLGTFTPPGSEIEVTCTTKQPASDPVE